MDISLAKRIQEAFPKLSKKHRMLAEHLSKNYDGPFFKRPGSLLER